MLPTDRPLTTEEIDNVARTAKLWMHENKLSQNDVARKLGKGFGPSTICNFLNKVKRGGEEKVARALNELMERQESASQIARPRDFVEIETARRMLAVIKTAVDTRCLGEIVGASGMGKTKVLLAAKAMYTNAIYVRIVSTSRAPTGFIRAFCAAANIPYRTEGSISMRNIEDRLRDTGRPILIDELHQARYWTLETVRDIHDITGCPIILCGTEPLAKMVADRERFFGQFNRRIVARFNADEWMRTTRDRGRPLFSPEEILQIFATEKLRLTQDGAEFLSGIASLPNEGGLGLVEKIVLLAGRISKLQGKPLTGAILMKVLREMHGGAYGKFVEQKAEHLQIRLTAGVA